MKKGPRVCKASIAFACDNSVIASVHNYAGEKDPEALLRRALDLGGEVFVGVRLGGREARDVRSRVDCADTRERVPRSSVEDGGTDPRRRSPGDGRSHAPTRTCPPWICPPSAVVRVAREPSSEDATRDMAPSAPVAVSGGDRRLRHRERDTVRRR